ncbi:MAG: hypothetical protein ABI557_05105, partial [Aureliella sp.]
MSDIQTGNGAIDIVATGSVFATHVDSSATDSDANDVSILTTAGDVSAMLVRAGTLQGDVVLDSQGSIIDGDNLVDDVDVEGNAVTLIARTGSIGIPAGNFFKDRPDGLEVFTHADPLLPLQPGNLTVSAAGGSIALHATVAGALLATADTLFVLSDGDLDVSTSTFVVANLGLIADADGDGAGTLTLGGNLTVTGDMRIEGADIVATGPAAPQLDIAATRVLLRSGAQADLLVAAQILDATAQADLTVTSTGTSIELVDLDCDNIAVQTLNGNASIALHSSGNVVVADDVLAGNDGSTSSTGSINFDFVAGTVGNMVIHDTLLTDAGSISLTAAGSIVLETPAVADPEDAAGADNLAVITTVAGNIALHAQGLGGSGQIFMADGTQIIAGRAALVDYVAGIDGLPSPSTITLGNIAQPVGQAEISLSATDNITIASLQSAGTSLVSVQVATNAGAIIDGGDSDVDVIAHQLGAGAKLTSFAGIGSANAIDIGTPAIEARNLGTTGNLGLHQVTAGGDLQTLAAINLADGGSVLVAVDAGNLDIAVAGSVALNGDITLLASNDLYVQSNVQTTGTGDILLRAGNATDDATPVKVDGITIDASLSAERGSVLLQSFQDVRVSSAIVSTAGSVGLIAIREITQFDDVTAGADVFIEAGGDYTQTAASTTAAGTVQVITSGTQRLGLLSANHIALEATGDLLDNNGANTLNLRANSLRMVAGGIIGGADLLAAPDINANALDLEVGTMAARSAQGIYLQELSSGADLIVGHVEGNAGLTVRQVALDGTSSPVAVGDGDPRSLDNLMTTAGPIKVVVRGGNLTINDGSDADGVGVSAADASDILLSAGANLDINARVSSVGGHISLQATNDVDVDAAVSTTATGSVYVAGRDLRVNAIIDSVAGDQLLTATRDLSVSSALTSATGSIGILAGRDISQSANVTAGGDVFINATGNLTQSSGTSTTAADTVQFVSGGTQRLALLTAARISLDAGSDLLDNNGANTLNLKADSLRMVAGGTIGGSNLANTPDANDNALDMEVGTVAAQSTRGIYLQELASGGDLAVGHAQGSASISVQQVRFNSTVSLVTAGDVAGTAPQPLDDLATSTGPIKVVVRDGSLSITDGADGDGLGVTATGVGDILLWASANLDINAQVRSGGGNISLQAGTSVVGNINVGAAVFTSATGSIYVAGRDIGVNAAVTTAAGDQLLSATRDLNINAALTSAAGSIGLLAGRNISQASNISAGGDVLIDAQGALTQTIGTTTTAGDTLLITSQGDQLINLLSANHIVLNAGGDILDNNGANTLNLRANTLSMQAGGIIGGADLPNAPDANGNALDLEVGTVAARSARGIYLQQLASGGDLAVGHVQGASGV